MGDVPMQLDNKEEGPYESPEDKHSRRVRIGWNWSMGTLIAAIVAFFPINKAYDQYHVRLARDVVVAEIQTLQESVDDTQKTANESAHKIDFLVKAEAARSVDAIGVQIIILKSQAKTPTTDREIFDLEQRLGRAISYRDCVFAGRNNCDALRVW